MTFTERAPGLITPSRKREELSWGHKKYALFDMCIE